MYTTIAITTTSTLLDYSETMESPGDELDYLDAVNSAREDGFSVWEQKGEDTFFQTELRDEFGVIVRITLMTDLATCYPAGIGTLRDALDANEAEEPQVLETNEAEEPMDSYRIIVQLTDSHCAPYTWRRGTYQEMSDLLDGVETGGSEYDLYGIRSLSLVADAITSHGKRQRHPIRTLHVDR